MIRLLIVAVALAGCASATANASSTYVAPRTRATVEAEWRASRQPSTKSVVVMTQGVMSRIAPGVLAAPTAPADPGGGPDPVADLIERELLAKGWNPVSQPQLANLVMTRSVAMALRDLHTRSRQTLDDAAIVLGRAAQADTVLVVRAWRTSFAAAPAIQGGGFSACPASAELEAVAYDYEGSVYWRGTAVARSTDQIELKLTAGEEGAKLIPASHGCVGQDGCRGCRGDGAPKVEGDMERSLATQAAKTLANAITAAPAR